jgi:hypothetical protein
LGGGGVAIEFAVCGRGVRVAACVFSPPPFKPADAEWEVYERSAVKKDASDKECTLTIESEADESRSLDERYR